MKHALPVSLEFPRILRCRCHQHAPHSIQPGLNPLVVQNHSAVAEDLPHRRTRRSAAALCQGAHWPKVVGDWSLTVALIAHSHLRCIRTFIDP